MWLLCFFSRKEFSMFFLKIPSLPRSRYVLSPSPEAPCAMRKMRPTTRNLHRWCAAPCRGAGGGVEGLATLRVDGWPGWWVETCWGTWVKLMILRMTNLEKFCEMNIEFWKWQQSKVEHIASSDLLTFRDFFKKTLKEAKCESIACEDWFGKLLWRHFWDGILGNKAAKAGSKYIFL